MVPNQFSWLFLFFRNSSAKIGIYSGGTDEDANSLPKRNRKVGEAKQGAQDSAASQKRNPDSHIGQTKENQSNSIHFIFLLKSSEIFYFFTMQSCFAFGATV